MTSALQAEIAEVTDPRFARLERRIEELAALLSDKPQPEWVTVKEAADHLGVSAQTVRRRCHDGQYETNGTGRGLRVRWRDLG